MHYFILLLDLVILFGLLIILNMKEIVLYLLTLSTIKALQTAIL